jgi:hypothetical protein
MQTKAPKHQNRSNPVILYHTPSLGVPDKSENIFRLYLGYILGYILDISKIYLGYRCIPDISQMYPRYIPDLSNISDLSRIYPGFIPDDR